MKFYSVFDKNLVIFNMKQIFRNKRGYISYFYLLGLLLIFCFFIFPLSLKIKENVIMNHFYATIFLGIFLISHFQFFFAWDSGFIDFLHTANIDLKKYFISRLIGVILLILPIYFFSFLLIIYNKEYLLMGISGLLYNIGFSSLYLISISLFATQKIDINKSPFFYYTGATLTHNLSIFIVIIIPVFILLIFRKNPITGFILISMLGIIFILFSSKIIDNIYNNYLLKKYKIINALR